MRFNPPDSYWKKDVLLFFSRKFALILKFAYPLALIVPVSASGIPAQYGAAVVGIVAIMAGTFGAGETLTTDLNDGILMRYSLTPLRPQRIAFEILGVNAALDFLQLLPALLIMFLLHPVSPVWVAAALFGVFATLVTANCIGIFIANFTYSAADVLLYATAILVPLIYLSGLFRNQNPTGILGTIQNFIPFAYMEDALRVVFGQAAGFTPIGIFVYPLLICMVLAAAVCLTGPRLLSPRL